MVRISIHTDNCDLNTFYKIEESANSEIELRLEFDQIVSSQSKKYRREELYTAIQEQLKQFQWICAGSVNVELTWYLSSTERQETDKVGDLDNITKPILDALTGQRGLLIDDSQISSLYILWQSRNEQIGKNILYIRMQFINDECLLKENLIFVQYSGAICVPLNVDFDKIRDMVAALCLIKSRKQQRSLSKRMKKLAANVDRMLVVSAWDIHRSRLGGFDKSIIYSLEEFRTKCFRCGLSWLKLLHKIREYKRNK